MQNESCEMGGREKNREIKVPQKEQGDKTASVCGKMSGREVTR